MCYNIGKSPSTQNTHSEDILIQLGFLDFDTRLHRLDKAGDPLATLNEIIDWEIFRPTIEKARRKEKKSNAGAPGFDAVVLFKILNLQSLYNLSDGRPGVPDS